MSEDKHVIYYEHTNIQLHVIKSVGFPTRYYLWNARTKEKDIVSSYAEALLLRRHLLNQESDNDDRRPKPAE